MISNKRLSIKLQELIILLKDFANLADQQWEKDAFLQAQTMVGKIISCLDSDNYDEARYLWSLLRRFINDSIPISEYFLSRYMPLEQSIINLDLR